MKDYYPLLIVEKLSENKVAIRNSSGGAQYFIDNDLISNEEATYTLINEILLERESNKINWTNLKSNECGIIDIPYNYFDIPGYTLSENKILILANSDVNGGMNTVAILDLQNNKIEKEVNVGEFEKITPIDEDRIFIESRKGLESILEIFNLNNQTRKEIVKYKYAEEKGQPYSELFYLIVTESKDKVYYCETDGYKIYLKAAVINDMTLEESITLYEKDSDRLTATALPNIIISKDEREVTIYDFNKVEGYEKDVIDKFEIIKLSK